MTGLYKQIEKITEEVQVTSLSTYLPVTLWGGSSKQLGACKQKLLHSWFTQRITMSTGTKRF
jgi:hypothetical protein